MPNYFKYLCTDVVCFTSPASHHFGLSWAQQDPDDLCKITIGVSKGGDYYVLVTAKRNDICATMMCEQEVEYSNTSTLTTIPKTDIKVE
jgi:hypothetical protein